MITLDGCRDDYVATALQTDFPYTFQILAATDLAVYVNTSLVSPSLYTVSGVGDATGGTVAFLAGLTLGSTVIILSTIPQVQLEDLTTGGVLPAQTLEGMADKLTRLIHQANEAISRCLQLNVAQSANRTGLELPAPETLDTVAGGKKVISWNDTETNLELVEMTTQTGVLPGSLTSTTFAGLGAPGTPGRMKRVTDARQGLYVDTGTRWYRSGLTVLDAAACGFLPENSAAANSAVMTDMLAFLPQSGGRIYIPWQADPYQFDSTIAITKPMAIVGEMAYRHASAPLSRGTNLRFTGTGPAFTVDVSTADSTYLAHFVLDTIGGAATVGFEVGTGANDITLDRITILNRADTVPFTIAGVRFGQNANAHSMSMIDCYLRGCAPIGLQIVECNDTMKLVRSRFRSCDTNVQIGDGTDAKQAQEVTFWGCYFEDPAVAGIHIRPGAQYTRIEAGHWETFTDNASAILIEGGRETWVDGGSFQNGSSALILPIKINSATARVWINGAKMNAGNPLVGHIVNVLSQSVWVSNCQRAQLDTPWVADATASSTRKNVRFHGTVDAAETIQLEGRRVMLKRTAFEARGNVGGGSDNLIEPKIDAWRLGENGQGFRFVLWGITAANANLKTLTVTVAGREVLNTGAAAANAKDWIFTIHLLRTGSGAFTSHAFGIWNGALYNKTVGIGQTLIDNDWDEEVTVDVRATGVDTDDVVKHGDYLELLE